MKKHNTICPCSKITTLENVPSCQPSLVVVVRTSVARHISHEKEEVWNSLYLRSGPWDLLRDQRDDSPPRLHVQGFRPKQVRHLRPIALRRRPQVLLPPSIRERTAPSSFSKNVHMCAQTTQSPFSLEYDWCWFNHWVYNLNLYPRGANDFECGLTIYNSIQQWNHIVNETSLRTMDLAVCIHAAWDTRVTVFCLTSW